MKAIDQIQNDPKFQGLDESTRTTLLGIISDDTEAKIETLKQQYNEAEKRRDFVGMSAAHAQIIKMKNI